MRRTPLPASPLARATLCGDLFVEVKQRVNRVTRQRRVPYPPARRLCGEGVLIDHDKARRLFLASELGAE